MSDELATARAEHASYMAIWNALQCRRMQEADPSPVPPQQMLLLEHAQAAGARAEKLEWEERIARIGPLTREALLARLRDDNGEDGVSPGMLLLAYLGDGEIMRAFYAAPDPTEAW